jgi:eukaryotic-like serine/threonine-protein kinase
MAASPSNPDAPDPKQVKGSGARAGISDSVDAAVRRYWQNLAAGKRVSVDEVLDIPQTSEDYKITRQTVIQRLTDSVPDISDAMTLDSGSGISDQMTVIGADGGNFDAAANDATIAAGGGGGGGGGESLWKSSVGDTASNPTGLPQIEGYDITGKLGRGGMGVVFSGIQQATGRNVAIKFLLDAALASEAARQRFEREVEVVAGLQHPGIVAIIDSGVRKGRYYYVMDYVAGKPLDEALPVVEDPSKIDVRGVLMLFCDICDGVDYAHQRGVLHRDLKPSNILVDDNRKPHILDFGLAKRVETPGESVDAVRSRTAERSLTIAEPGQLLGTIAYMSPEQSLGQADQASVRADVYSLGVIAFELVTGRLPIKTEGSLRQVLAKIAEQDPPAPSTIVPKLSRDLDAVLLKALEKSPDRRYATAGELAADIRRYLKNEPVTARRIGAVGKSWRWVKRNQTLAATIVAAVVTLAGVSAALVVRIVRERDRANANYVESQKNFTLATERLELSQLNERVASQNFGILRAILESADPDKAGEPTVRQLLDGASSRLDKEPPDIDQTEASVREIVGSVYRKLGDYPKARANLERALAIREKQAKASAIADSPALAECLHNLAAVFWWAGDYNAAEPLYERALAMRRRLFSMDHRDIAMSLTHLAACRMRLGQHEEAHQLYAQALEMRKRLYGDEHEEVAQSLNNLAKSYLDIEEYAQAETLFRQALAMIIKLRGEQNPGTAYAVQNLAVCLLEKGDAADAKAMFERAVSIRQNMFPNGHHLIAGGLRGVSQSQLALGYAEDAERLARESVAMYTSFKRSEHPDCADALDAWGNALARLGRYAEAIERFKQGATILTRGLPATALQLAKLRFDMGGALLAQGRADEAVEVLRLSYQETMAIKRGRGKEVAETAEALAAALAKAGKPHEIEGLHEAARHARSQDLRPSK